MIEYVACEPGEGVSETEQLAVPAVEVALSVQLGGRLRGPTTGALVKATVPVGVPGVPLPVSVTVAVHVTEEPVRPGEGEQDTPVEVGLLMAVTRAGFDVFKPPFESVTVTETENVPGELAVTVQVVPVEPHPKAALSPV